MNAGLHASTGDVVALTDDDSEPRPDWLSRIVAVYESDSQVAATGGRDWVHTAEGGLVDGSARVVGVIDWLGRVTGNHHLGVGPARDVDVLKGVNLSVRGDLLREIGFDERLIGVGTEHHWELSLCLTLRRAGLRIVYDPRIAVDHHPQPRIGDSRTFNARELRDAAHNQTLAVLRYLPPLRRPLFLAWGFAIGTGSCRGLAQMIRQLPSRGRESWSLFLGSQSGMALGVLSFLRRSSSERRSASATGDATPSSGAAETEREDPPGIQLPEPSHPAARHPRLR
jgi:hypothetical protein